MPLQLKGSEVVFCFLVAIETAQVALGFLELDEEVSVVPIYCFVLLWLCFPSHQSPFV